MFDCSLVVLWLRETLAVFLGCCSYAVIPFFSLFLPCNFSLSVSSILLSFWAPGPYLLCSVFLITAIMQVTVLFWGFGLTKYRCPIILHSVPYTKKNKEEEEVPNRKKKKKRTLEIRIKK